MGCYSSVIKPIHSDSPVHPFLINPNSSGFPLLIINLPIGIYAISFYEANIIPKFGYATFFKTCNCCNKSFPYKKFKKALNYI